MKQLTIITMTLGLATSPLCMSKALAATSNNQSGSLPSPADIIPDAKIIPNPADAIPDKTLPQPIDALPDNNSRTSLEALKAEAKYYRTSHTRTKTTSNPITDQDQAPITTVSAATENNLDILPKPQTTTHIPKHLSLQDAILLALRNNPDVENSELQRIIDKYSLQLARYEFQPQYSLTGDHLIQYRMHPVTTVQGQTTLKSTLGTQMTVGGGYSFRDNMDTQTLSITQPLLRDFGAVNLISLDNARDTEESNKLSFKNSIISVVVQVIQNYYSVVQDYNNVQTQIRTLKRQQQTVDQYEEKVKVGKMARADLLQQEATLASTRLSTLETKNTLEQDYQTLIDNIGLNAETKVYIDREIQVDEYKLPTEDQAITMALAGNIEYQQSLLSIKQTERAVKSAENDRRWQLNATADVDMTGWHPDAAKPSLDFSLDIPIDDLNTRSALVNAKVSLVQAKLNLRQQKRTLIRDVLNNLTQLRNQYQTVKLSTEAVKLKRDSLIAEKIKLKYGKSTVFNVTQLEDELLSQQIDLTGNKISYLLDVTAFQQLLGQTLDNWNIKLRYYGKDETDNRTLLFGNTTAGDIRSGY